MGPAESQNTVLYGGPNSPFARMARVVGLEQGIDFVYRDIDVYNADFLDRSNPLRQIPTLIVGDSRAVFDSRTIFSFFDHLSNRPPLISPTDFDQATRVSLYLGLAEACLNYRMEIIRPEGERSERVIEKQKIRMQRCFDHIASGCDDTIHGDLRLEQIVLACALEYVEYRYSSDWREDFPKLNAFANQFGSRESMAVSQPHG